MIPGWFGGFPRRGSDANSQEIEALQTDVMRFVAILGFVLMAIFALVQTLPVGPPDIPPSLEDPESLQREVERLRQQAQQLSGEFQVLEGVLAQAQQDEQELVAIAPLLLQAKSALRDRHQQLGELHRQIQARRISLTELRRDLAVQRRSLSIADERLAAASAALDDLQRVIPDQASEAEVGFSLRFASDEALTALLRTRSVRVFAMLGQRTWQLSAGAKSIFAETMDRPGSFYEMNRQTVPPTYRAALRRVTAVLDDARITWGVTLPQPTRAAITRLMERYEGGELIIQADGSVERR